MVADNLVELLKDQKAEMADQVNIHRIQALCSDNQASQVQESAKKTVLDSLCNDLIIINAERKLYGFKQPRVLAEISQE